MIRRWFRRWCSHLAFGVLTLAGATSAAANDAAHGLWGLGVQIGIAELASNQGLDPGYVGSALGYARNLALQSGCVPTQEIDSLLASVRGTRDTRSVYPAITAYRQRLAGWVAANCNITGSAPSALPPSADNRRAFCDPYARNATSQNEENLRRRCGQSGARWHSDTGAHFNWCMTVDTATANLETRARDEALARCDGPGPGASGPAFDPKRIYRLVAKHSGRVLDVNLPDRDQAPVVQNAWHGGDNQRWRIEPLGDGTYRLVAKHSGRVLDVNLPDRDQARVVQHTWHGGDNQRWKIEPVGAGFYRLVAKHSNRVLDVNLPDRDQAIVVQHTWHGGDNQRWKIEIVE